MKRKSFSNQTFGRPAAFGIMALVALTTSCSLKSRIGSDGIVASVTFAANATSDLGEVVLIAGADKTHWGTLTHGQTVSTILSPMGEPPEVFMTYVFAGQKLSWEGPRLAKGTGHRIHISINAHGDVSEQHCIQPCRLP